MKPAYEVKTQTPSFEEGALAEARELIGVELRRDEHNFSRYSDPDPVRRYCYSIGDSNPLFMDEEYAASTPWGQAVAPGCFLYTIDTTIVAPKLRGIQWVYSGTKWDWYREIPLRERINVDARLTDAVEKSGNFASKFIIQSGEVNFADDKGDLFATAIGSTARIPRAKADGGLSYEARTPHRYSAEEIAEIEAMALTMVPRGSEPLYWEDVPEGEEIPRTVKGPLNIVDMISWYSGGGHAYYAHERDVVHRRRHPADAFVNPDTGADEHPARGHMEPNMAKEVGMPGVYDVGLQRISWIQQQLQLWMGDRAFLRSLDVQIRRPNVLGDTTWCHAKVTGKSMGPDPEYRGSVPLSGIVDLEVWAVNQLGDVNAKGTARVLLPTKED